MGAIASQITSLTVVYATVYSGSDQRKHQSSASLAFVWRIHRGPVNSPHKWPVTRKIFHLMTSWWFQIPIRWCFVFLITALCAISHCIRPCNNETCLCDIILHTNPWRGKVENLTGKLPTYTITTFWKMSNISSMEIRRNWTHCGLATPYGHIDLGQHWLR